MDKSDFREYYAELPDGELAKIASSRRNLVPEARVCLDEELARRKLTPGDIKRFKNYRHSYRDPQSPIVRKLNRSKLLDKVNELRKIPTFGWHKILFGMALTFLLGGVFDYFGALNALMPVACTATVLFFTLRLHWELKCRPWFWATLGTWIALHVWIIVRVHWPNRWIPGRSWAGGATIDLVVLFVIIALIEKLLHEGRFAPPSRQQNEIAS